MTDEENAIAEQSKKELEQLRQIVSKLYLHLNVEQYELEKEQKILKQLELLKTELEPMEKVLLINFH